MPSSSVIRPFFTRSTEVPVKRIFLPEPSGREPMGRSLKAFPVCVPPPLPDHIFALGDEISGAPEIQVREGRAKLGGELLHVLTAAAGRMHRVFETDVWGCKFVDDGRVPGVPPEFGKPTSDNRLV